MSDEQRHPVLVRVTPAEVGAIFAVAKAFDELGYAKRGSYGATFESFANRLDETGEMQRPDPERCKACKGSGWVENWPPALDDTQERPS